jgi:hypothetical protein
LPVVLIDPDGNIIDTTLNDTGVLRGQINYETMDIDPQTGADMVVNLPVVALRRSSLSRVPEAGEKWFVKIPVSPVEGAAIEDFILSETRPPEGGAGIGFVRLYLQRAAQV